MMFTRNEKAFCVLEYTQTQSDKGVQHVFSRKCTYWKADLDMPRKIQRGSLSVQ